MYFLSGTHRHASPVSMCILTHMCGCCSNVKTAVATAYLWSKREAYVRAGFDRWRLTGAYVKAWLPQHALEVARALVDAAFPGFTPFQVGMHMHCSPLLLLCLSGGSFSWLLVDAPSSTNLCNPLIKHLHGQHRYSPPLDRGKSAV